MMKNVGPNAFNTTKKSENIKVKDLKSKIMQLQRQIRDVGHEGYLEKECLLEDIRDLTK